MDSAEITARVFGAFDKNIELVEAAFSVTIRNRRGDHQGEDGDMVQIEGETTKAVEDAEQVLRQMRLVARQGDVVPEQSVRYLIDMTRAGQGEIAATLQDDCISVTVIATGFDEKSANKSVKNDDLEWDFISKARPVEAAPSTSAAGTVVPPSQDNDDYLDVMTYFTKKKD